MTTFVCTSCASKEHCHRHDTWCDCQCRSIGEDEHICDGQATVSGINRSIRTPNGGR